MWYFKFKHIVSLTDLGHYLNPNVMICKKKFYVCGTVFYFLSGIKMELQSNNDMF